MLKVERKFCVNSWDIEKEWPEANFNVCSMPFAECAENDSYIPFYMGSDHLDELEYRKKHWGHNERYIKSIESEIELLNKFKEMGFKTNDEILIFISY